MHETIEGALEGLQGKADFIEIRWHAARFRRMDYFDVYAENREDYAYADGHDLLALLEFLITDIEEEEHGD